MGLKLWFDSASIVMESTDDAKGLLEKIDFYSAFSSKTVTTIRMGESKKPPKEVKTAQFRFWFKSKAYKVAKKRLTELRKAVVKAIEGEEAEFQMGFRAAKAWVEKGEEPTIYGAKWASSKPQNMMDYEKYGYRKNPVIAELTKGLSTDEFNTALTFAHQRLATGESGKTLAENLKDVISDCFEKT